MKIKKKFLGINGMDAVVIKPKRSLRSLLANGKLQGIKLTGMLILFLIIGFGFTACDEGDGGGNITFNIINNHTVAIKSVAVGNGSANNYQPFTKDVSIAADGGTGSVTFNLEKNPIGYMISSFTVTFTDDAWVGSNSMGSYSSTTINVTITDAGSSGLSWDAQ